MTRLLPLLFLMGCAALPPCPVANVLLVRVPSSGALLFVFDVDNIAVIESRLDGLRDGTCESTPFWAKAGGEI